MTLTNLASDDLQRFGRYDLTRILSQYGFMRRWATQPDVLKPVNSEPDLADDSEEEMESADDGGVMVGEWEEEATSAASSAADGAAGGADDGLGEAHDGAGHFHHHHRPARAHGGVGVDAVGIDALPPARPLLMADGIDDMDDGFGPQPDDLLFEDGFLVGGNNIPPPADRPAGANEGAADAANTNAPPPANPRVEADRSGQMGVDNALQPYRALVDGESVHLMALNAPPQPPQPSSSASAPEQPGQVSFLASTDMAFDPMSKEEVVARLKRNGGRWV